MRPSSRRPVRHLVGLAAVAGLVLAACGDDGDDASDDTGQDTSEDSSDDGGSGDDSETEEPAEDADIDADAPAGDTCSNTITDGVLTIATGEPAFPPYVIDDAPESGEGFEAAVAYAVAREMGYDADAVEWTRTTFEEAIQPGAKSFDFNLQQYSITPEREETITFSDPYYTSNQAIVGLDGSAAEGATTLEDLKDVKFGAQAGTTSLQFIEDVIQPNEEPFVYNDNVGAKAALDANQIDAAVFDLPTAFYVSAVEIEGSSVIAQFPAEAGGTTDQFGLVFEKDNPLVECADAAIATLTESGELADITEQWMSTETGAPIIEVG